MMNFSKKNKALVLFALTSLSLLVIFQNFAPNDELLMMTPKEICEAQQDGKLPANALDITSLGADPKGKLDSYDAFVKAAQLLSNKKDSIHRVLVLPSGTYYIDRFSDGTFKTFTKKIAEAKKNNVILPSEDMKLGNHITFEKSTNFRIVGCDAVVSVKGNFFRGSTDRSVNVSGQILYYPERFALTPFHFKDSSNFGVYGYSVNGKYGLELNGNVDKMSRDAQKPQLEANGTGLSTANCRHYNFENLDIHHFSVDGITVGSGGSSTVKKVGDKIYTYVLTDYNGSIQNIRSANNGRQGMSVISVRKLSVRDSIFSNTGRTGLNNLVNTKFPGFSPQAGVDIEPNFGTTPVEYMENRFILQDYITQDVRFYSSRFEDNIGIQIVAGTNNTYGLYLYDPIIGSTYSGKIAPANYPNSQIYTAWLEGRLIRVYRGQIDTHTGAVHAAAKSFSDVSFEGVNITTSGSGLLSVGSGRLVLLNSKIVQKQEVNETSPARYMPYIQNKNPNSLIGRNRFFYSKDFVKNGFQVVGLFQGVCYSDPSKYKVWGNRFETDYVGESKMTVSYTGSRVGVGVKNSGDFYPHEKVLMPYVSDGEFIDGYYISQNVECR